MARKGQNSNAGQVNNLTQKINSLTKKLDAMKMGNPSPASTGKKRRRNNRQPSGYMAAPTDGYMTMDRSTTFHPKSDMVVSKASDTGLRRLREKPRAGLSDQGIAFLKCAFAPPDFSMSSIQGVPDDFRGQSLTVKHRAVIPFTVTAGLDYYILLLPIPGYAYFIASVATGTSILYNTTFQGVTYSDFGSMFGGSGSSADSQVDKFRFVSNHFEIIPTVNSMTWSGNIQSWKLPISVTIRQGGSGVADLWTVSGLQGVNSSLTNQYSGPFIMGCYSGCYNADCDFEFSQILRDVLNIPTAPIAADSDFGELVAAAGVNIPGFDNHFESQLFKISSVTANETCLLKTWACVEYQVRTDSVLYKFQQMSPCDRLALELYREVITGLPVAVPFEENAGFWERVLGIIQQISAVGSLAPGPYGMLAKGINLTTGGLRSLLF